MKTTTALATIGLALMPASALMAQQPPPIVPPGSATTPQENGQEANQPPAGEAATPQENGQEPNQPPPDTTTPPAAADTMTPPAADTATPPAAGSAVTPPENGQEPNQPPDGEAPAPPADGVGTTDTTAPSPSGTLTPQTATPPALSPMPGASAPPSAPASGGVAADVTDPAAFAENAASANLFEIRSSELALTQSQDEEVRAFAQQMIDDHTAAGEAMRQAAQEAGVTVPEAMSDEDQQKLTDLQSAGDFDQAYIAAQTEAHDAAVSLFQGFAENGEAGPLKAFAEETLPKLQDHQTRVKALGGM